MSKKACLKDLPSYNPANFSKFESNSDKSQISVYLSTVDKPSEQVIMSDRSNILLRYLYQQLDRKMKNESKKQRSENKTEESEAEATTSNETSDAATTDGPPRKQPRMSSG